MHILGKELGSLSGGALVLSATGKHTLLLAVSITAVLVGSAVITSTIFRLIAKRAYKNQTFIN